MPKTLISRGNTKLSLKQENFCKLYTEQGTEFYGNGVQSYMEAYGDEYRSKHGKPLPYRTAGVLAHKQLKKVKIINRINELLEEGGFNDQNVDKQHLFLINQYADLKTKLGAVKEYNTLKKRTEGQLGSGNVFVQVVQNILNSNSGSEIIRGTAHTVSGTARRQEVASGESVLDSGRSGKQDSVQTELGSKILAGQSVVPEHRPES